MSPAALGLAILLHILVAMATWWLSQDRFHFTPGEEVVEVTLEPLPKPEPAAPPPPLIEDLRPPADITADKPTQVPPVEQSKAPSAPAPPMARPTPTPPPLLQPAPPAQQVAPGPQPQAPPPSPADFTKPGPTPAPQQQHQLPQQPHQQQALAAPTPHPPPQAPKPELRPSPLTTTPQRRPPGAPPGAEQPSPHPFVNPADTYNRALVSDNYLWQVARKLSGYRYQADTKANEGLTVVKVVIARNGRLLDVSVIRSSGIPEFDHGVLAGVRQGSPYSPLPSEIRGESAAFTLPLVSSRR
jgi:TonB family protein